MKYASLLIAAVSLIIIGGAVPASAQHRGPGGGAQGVISGSVIDSAAGTSLAGATIAIRSAEDSVLVNGAIADHDGGFSITGLRPGRYFARISFVGFATRFVRNIEITADAPQASIGRITMVTDATLSNGVTVTGKREFMTLAIDRTIYKASDLTIASGGDATDVLRNIPSIDVDADGNVSLRGSQNVVVQINGRPTMMSGTALAAFLRSLPAGSVERVEVMPNPSAKYDPDGLSGIINIVLKQNSDRGLSGGFNGSLGSDPDATIGGNIGYGSGPWNLYANYAFSYELMKGEATRIRNGQVPGVVPHLSQTGGDTTRTRSHTLNATVDYALADGHSLNLTAFISKRMTPYVWLTRSSESDLSGELTGRNDRTTNSDDAGLSTDARLGYKWVLEPQKHELSAELRYSYQNNTSAKDYITDFFAADGTPLPSAAQRRGTDEHDLYHTYTGQVDYTRSIGEHGTLEAGYKGEKSRISNDMNAHLFDTATHSDVPDVPRINTFSYDRQIHAGYLTYTHEFGELEAQAGLRAETETSTFNLKTTAQSFDNDYTSLFPSVFVSYKPVEALQLKVSYSRRIDRPSLWQLNPFPDFDDPTFRSIGNPDLKPQYTDSYDFTLAWYFDQGSLTVNPFFRRTHDYMGRWESFDSLGMAILTYKNFATANDFGADVIASYRLGERASGFLVFSAFQDNLDATNVEAGLTHKTLIWYARANATVNLLDGLDMQVGYTYRAPIDIVGGKINGSTSGDIALTWKMFEKRGSLGLTLSDPFKGMGFWVYRTYGGYYESFDRTWNSRTLSLTFSYTFGNPGRQPRQQAPEEQQHSGGGFGM